MTNEASREVQLAECYTQQFFTRIGDICAEMSYKFVVGLGDKITQLPPMESIEKVHGVLYLQMLHPKYLHFTFNGNLIWCFTKDMHLDLGDIISCRAIIEFPTNDVDLHNVSLSCIPHVNSKGSPEGRQQRAEAMNLAFVRDKSPVKRDASVTLVERLTAIDPSKTWQLQFPQIMTSG